MMGTRHRAGEIFVWLLVAIYAVASLLPSFAPRALSLDVQLSLVVFLPLAFALIHGALRHGIVVFAILCFVVSNAFENLGVLTGFPFGRYVYTDAMGPKLFVVPLLIGPAYLGAGYTSWVLASILLGEIDRVPDRLAVVAVPIVAAFIMVGWDVCFDPGSSTLDRLWTWRDGGGYFGVPLTNYLGWYLTVFVFLFLFSLYRARRQTTDATRLSSTYWAQPAVLFLIMALVYETDYLAGSDVTLTDATGATWRSADIHETAAIVSLFTMVFVAVTCLLILARRARG
ncbi:MAG TPA: carotenoid biosynthesis protein [Stellaceae bacterium]|nr:carotenoid biosynthesis protein [Stellaceae bacterium]